MLRELNEHEVVPDCGECHGEFPLTCENCGGLCHAEVEYLFKDNGKEKVAAFKVECDSCEKAAPKGYTEEGAAQLPAETPKPE